jgi:hypothetical protein
MHGLQWDYSLPRSPHGESPRFTLPKLIAILKKPRTLKVKKSEIVPVLN